MCDCSNYCQLLVGPRRRAPHRGSFVDARRWAFGRVAAPARLATARSWEIARSPDLCTWRVRAGPRGVDEELRLPGARHPSWECQSRRNSLDYAPEVVPLVVASSSQSRQDRWCIGIFP